MNRIQNEEEKIYIKEKQRIEKNEYRNSYTILQNSNTNTKYIYQTIREREEKTKKKLNTKAHKHELVE